MPFCASCGSPVEGRFCAKCGATVGDASAPPPTPGFPPPVTNYPPPVPPPGTAGMAENAASALCYVLGLITGILFLVLEPYNKNRTVRFHAFQSIFFNIALIPFYIVVGIFTFILGHVPVLGPILAMLIYAVLGFGMFGLWLFLMYKAYNKEKFMLPFIGALAEKQAGA